MVLRVGQVHHRAGGGAEADDALADTQPRAPHGVRIQPLGGRELQNVAGTLDVDGAYFADQFGRHKLNKRRQRGGAVGTQIP